MEGQEGLEHSTFCLRGRRSNQLSYWPTSQCDASLRYAKTSVRYFCQSTTSVDYSLQKFKIEDFKFLISLQITADDLGNVSKLPLFWQDYIELRPRLERAC